MPTLDWLNREQAMRVAETVPYRMLEPVSVHGDPAAQNLLIQGDNLEALKALLPFYRGRVKCIYIDPPYNTKSAFEHYDDNLEHSQWLSMMHPRLPILLDRGICEMPVVIACKFDFGSVINIRDDGPKGLAFGNFWHEPKCCDWDFCLILGL
jgi:hypothetical protein